MTSVPVSLPRGFVRRVDRAAASFDLRRGPYIAQRVRSWLLSNRGDEFVIPSSRERFREGRRVACRFSCQPQIARLMAEQFTRYSMDLSEFVFHVLRVDFIERQDELTVKANHVTPTTQTKKTKPSSGGTKQHHRLRRHRRH